MHILVTGAAGFIGFHLVQHLTKMGHSVVGLDNLNTYYDVKLKLARLQRSEHLPQYRFQQTDLTDSAAMRQLFAEERFDLVLHMAAQAGVRYSLENPEAYVQSNLVGFLELLECCRHYGKPRLIYASSSSVYGMSDQVPFEEDARTDQPVSLYAATKKSNELLAYSYSHLYNLDTTGLRFFTVYGPWGRPDMAMFLFTDAVMNDRPIKVYNHGNLARDFTFIDDVVQGIGKMVNSNESGQENYKIYNIGRSKPVNLMEFIAAIEESTEKKAILDHQDMQPGDVERTWADVSKLHTDFDYSPSISVRDGVRQFVDWYRNEYLSL